MNRHLRVLVTVALALLFVFNGCVTHSKKVTLDGYQEFKWGMPRSTVESILRRNNASVSFYNKFVIEEDSKIELRGLSHPTSIKRIFLFLNDSLERVSLDYYRHSFLDATLDTVYSMFYVELHNEYGHPLLDTMTIDERTKVRWMNWQFQAGNVQLRSAEWVKLSSDPSLKQLFDRVTLEYSKKGIEGNITRNKEYQTAKRFCPCHCSIHEC